jgi:hypothetical protein
VLTTFTLRRFFARRRYTVAALCAVLAIGVVAHHAMPGPMAPMGAMGHGAADHKAMDTMVVCLAVASLGGLLALAARARWRAAKRPPVLVWRARRPVAPPPVARPQARAGPRAFVVLRL